MLVVELAVVALGAVAVARAVRERGRTRAALERAVLADRRYRAWSGERSRAMAARNTLFDVAQASGEAARKVQRGSTAVAGALGQLGGRVADSVRRLAASTPELSRGSVVKGSVVEGSVVEGRVVSSAEVENDWFALMLEAAEAEDRARAEGYAEVPTALMPVVAAGKAADPGEQLRQDLEDEDEDPADPDVEPTVVVDVPPDVQWLEDVPRDG